MYKTLLTLNRPAKKQKTCTTTSLLSNARRFLLSDVRAKIEAAVQFPPSLNDETTHHAIQNFQTFIDTVVSSEQDVCVSCGLFIAAGFKHIVKQTDPLLNKAFDALLFTDECLDNCGKHGEEPNKELWFCDKCFIALTDAKIPKFGWSNQVNLTACHQFPSELNDLTRENHRHKGVGVAG